jgi:hypothetical protein
MNGDVLDLARCPHGRSVLPDYQTSNSSSDTCINLCIFHLGLPSSPLRPAHIKMPGAVPQDLRFRAIRLYKEVRTVRCESLQSPTDATRPATSFGKGLVRHHLSTFSCRILTAAFSNSPDPAYEFNKRLRRVYESTSLPEPLRLAQAQPRISFRMVRESRHNGS